MSDPTPDPIMETFYDVPNTPDESTPNNDIFHATSSNTSDMDGLYYFDPSDIKHGNTFVLEEVEKRMKNGLSLKKPG